MRSLRATHLTHKRTSQWTPADTHTTSRSHSPSLSLCLPSLFSLLSPSTLPPLSLLSPSLLLPPLSLSVEKVIFKFSSKSHLMPLVNFFHGTTNSGSHGGPQQKIKEMRKKSNNSQPTTLQHERDMSPQEHHLAEKTTQTRTQKIMHRCFSSFFPCGLRSLTTVSPTVKVIRVRSEGPPPPPPSTMRAWENSTHCTCHLQARRVVKKNARRVGSGGSSSKAVQELDNWSFFVSAVARGFHFLEVVVFVVGWVW